MPSISFHFTGICYTSNKERQNNKLMPAPDGLRLYAKRGSREQGTTPAAPSHLHYPVARTDSIMIALTSRYSSIIARCRASEWPAARNVSPGEGASRRNGHLALPTARRCPSPWPLLMTFPGLPGGSWWLQPSATPEQRLHQIAISSPGHHTMCRPTSSCSGSLAGKSS